MEDNCKQFTSTKMLIEDYINRRNLVDRKYKLLNQEQLIKTTKIFIVFGFFAVFASLFLLFSNILNHRIFPSISGIVLSIINSINLISNIKSLNKLKINLVKYYLI